MASSSHIRYLSTDLIERRIALPQKEDNHAPMHTTRRSRDDLAMARTPVLAAGGIVLRQAATPLVAVVRLRKRNEWVLPKGKLDSGETPRAAAEREVNEETGHNVSVHEFLGTLVYDSRSGTKVVHFWRMEAGREPVRKLMRDVKAVEWLPLEDAVDRLSRGYERAFLEQVGPIALSAVNAPVVGAAVARTPDPARVETIEHIRDRRNLLQRMRDWLRRTA
jgi:8-oxo-dGTP diphosphatase